MTPGYAIIVPVGPGEIELRRFRDLMDSALTYEPQVRLCVVIDASPERRDLRLKRTAPGCRFITLQAPYDGRGEPMLGRLSAAILLSLRTVLDAGQFEFVLRLDTDALIIGAFRDAVLAFIELHPDAGMIGTLGCTCRREAWYYGIEENAYSDVFCALDTAAGVAPQFDRIRKHAQLAIENGYRGKEYCQGGAYVLPFETLARMSAVGCLEFPEDWLPMAVPEDVMMGLYARSVGLRSLDFSLPGEPFGNHFRGLAYSPRELVRRGHAIIHSTKRDEKFSEWDIRRYFRARRRRSAAKRRSNARSVSASV